MLPRYKTALLALAAVTLPTLPAFAQSGAGQIPPAAPGPIPLTSTQMPAPPAPPSPVPPAILPLGSQEAPPPSASGPIQVQELASLNPNEIGLLDAAHGGLGTDMWGNSSLGLISKALPLLPNQPGWRSLRRLQLRLLESAATLPAGKPAGEPLLVVRVGKLAAMAAMEDAKALLKMVPSPAMSPSLRRLQIDAALLSLDKDSACAQESALRGMPAMETYDSELQVFCQFAAGKTSEATLSVDLLREQKLKDAPFFTAADTLSGLPPAKAEGFADASPLALAMAAMSKLTLPDNLAGQLPPAHLPLYARAGTVSLEARLAAAERAVNSGAAGPDLLRQIYDGLTLTASEQLSGATDSGKTARGRALLYRAAAQQVLPQLKAEIIQRGLAADPINAPLLYAPMLMGMSATPDLVNFAPWAVRALLAAGQTDACRPWFGLMRAEAALGGASPMVAALKPLERLAGLTDQPLTALDLTAWRQARNENAVDAGKHGLLLLSLLAATGDVPPDNEWLALLDGPPVISGKMSRSALAIGLMNAAAGQRRGETVLYVLLGLGETRDVEPAEFGRLIGALRAVGLTADARALALELALAYGI